MSLQVGCNDNGTQNDGNDDRIKMTLYPSGNNLSPNGYRLSAKDEMGASIDVTSIFFGQVFLTTTGQYNERTDFLLEPGTANGTKKYTIKIWDSVDGSCIKEVEIDPVPSCSQPCIDCILVTYSAPNPPYTISDGDPSVLKIPFDFDVVGIIKGMTVSIQGSHDLPTDLSVVIESPMGTRIEVMQQTACAAQAFDFILGDFF